MYTSRMKPNPEEMVVLTAIPQGFLDDLPEEDQQAIREIVGKPVLLNEYDDAGRAELEFNDRDGQPHFIFVPADFIALSRPAASREEKVSTNFDLCNARHHPPEILADG